MKITEKIEYYATVTKKADALYEQVRELRAEADTVKQEIAEDLRELGFKQAKSEDGKYVAFFGERKALAIEDPQKVRDWMQANNIDERAYFTPDKRAIDTLARQALRETGEIIPGTQLGATESFTIKENK